MSGAAPGPGGPPGRGMSDGEALLADRLAHDLERVLGIGILVDDLVIEGDGPVTVRAACFVDGQAREVEASGETVGGALAELVRLAAETRLASAFWQMVGPG